jgi:hypothetical protein
MRWKSAWEYAYRFSLITRAIPLALVRVWDDYKARPLDQVVGQRG